MRDREDRDQKSKLSRKQLPETVQEVGRVEHAKAQERKSEKLPERRSSHRMHHGSQMSPVSDKDFGRVENVEGKRQRPSQVEKEDNSDLDAKLNSDSKDKKRRKTKRSERDEAASDSNGSSDSDLEDRKEAKRRRKEEKKTKKEEKKRRREERRRKREERRGEKQKLKNREYSDSSEGEAEKNKNGEESDPKRLEIELRNKALESLKAKKGISH